MENEEEVGDDHGGLLEHENDDPLCGLPEICATDEEMLQMMEDPEFLKKLRQGLSRLTDEQFEASVSSTREALRETIAANDE
jgi:hypothetical protein